MLFTVLGIVGGLAFGVVTGIMLYYAFTPPKTYWENGKRYYED